VKVAAADKPEREKPVPVVEKASARPVALPRLPAPALAPVEKPKAPAAKKAAPEATSDDDDDSNIPPPTKAKPAAPAPAPKAAAAPAAAKPSGGADGFLRLGSKPWTNIAVDGKDTGLHTPQTKIKLSAGPHRVTLTNPQFNIKETFSVDIKPGDTETVIKDLRQSSDDSD
jgi:hypothetical protein